MEFIMKRVRFAKPRIATFKDWYKTVFPMLRKNVGNDAHIHNTAVTGKEGTSTLYLNDSYAGSTLVRGNVNPRLKNPSSQIIKNTALASILSPLDTIDLMKMDIEGSEYEAFFNTADSLLKKVRNIIIEIHSSHSKYSEKDLVTHIEAAGFELARKKVEVYWFRRTDIR